MVPTRRLSQIDSKLWRAQHQRSASSEPSNAHTRATLPDVSELADAVGDRAVQVVADEVHGAAATAAVAAATHAVTA
jgi:hypothetical protein